MEADKRKRAPKAVQALAGTTTLLCHEISPSLVLTPYLLPCPQSSLLALAALNCERLPLQSEDVLPVPPGEERSGVRINLRAAPCRIERLRLRAASRLRARAPCRCRRVERAALPCAAPHAAQRAQAHTRSALTRAFVSGAGPAAAGAAHV
jgi:hypothetical protein